MKKTNVLSIFCNYNFPLCGYTIRSQEIVKNTKHFANHVVITIQDDKNWKIIKDVQGIKVYKIPLFPIKFGNLSLAPIRRRIQPRIYNWLINKVLRENKFDLVHAHTPHDISLPYIKYCKKRGLPTIYEVRGIWEDSKVDLGKAKKDQNYYQKRRAETKAMELANKVVVISEGLKKEIISRGVDKKKIILVPNGVNVADFKIIASKDKNLVKKYHLEGKTVLGYIGTVRKFEGLQLTILAMRKIIQKNSEVALLIVGDGEYLPELKKIVKKHHLQKNVIMTGEIAHKEIGRFYSLIDINLYPRINTKVCQVVTPLKPLEAMAMGKFVLASDVGGLKELVKPGISGDLFKAESALDLTKKILYYKKNPQKRQKIGKSARQWVKKNRDWKKLGKLYKDIYWELLKKNER